MADIRALLRSELASRKPSDTGRAGRKRKYEPEQEDVRKKTKAAQQHDELQPKETASEETIAGPAVIPEPDDSPIHSPPETAPLTELKPELAPEPEPEPQHEPREIDESEWSAFEREVVAPTRVPAIPAAAATLHQSATISAAPVTAAELKARERQERESRSKAQEAATLGDQEDATRLLEEELDEMEQLDQRVRKLKEKREEIRRTRMDEDKDESARGKLDVKVVEMVGGEEGVGNGEQKEGSDEDSDEDEYDEDEGWDNWRFR